MENQVTPQQQPASAILRMEDVIAKCGLSKTEIYRRLKAKTFPTAVCLGVRARGWRSDDIDAWINSLSQVSK
jgi:prophage regulatory protein